MTWISYGSCFLNTAPGKDIALLHKICVWTQIRKIKRKLNFNQSESRNKGLRFIFLTCVQTQISMQRAIYFAVSMVVLGQHKANEFNLYIN